MAAQVTNELQWDLFPAFGAVEERGVASQDASGIILIEKLKFVYGERTGRTVFQEEYISYSDSLKSKYVSQMTPDEKRDFFEKIPKLEFMVYPTNIVFSEPLG